MQNNMENTWKMTWEPGLSVFYKGLGSRAYLEGPGASCAFMLDITRLIFWCIQVISMLTKSS